MQRRALGKGLEALLPDLLGASDKRLMEIPTDRVRPNKFQPRTILDEAKLKELAASIKGKGVVQPILVSASADGYEIVAGERRWRAALMAGIDRIPAVIIEAEGANPLELALVENLLREDLNPLDEAEAYRKLVEDFGLSQEEVAKRVGKDRASIANYLRLKKLPAEVKTAIGEGKLTVGHAKAILSLESPSDQVSLKRQIDRKGLSVRQAESLASKMKSGPKLTGGGEKDPFIGQFEDRLRRRLATMVRIRLSRKGGKIEISFASQEELDRIVGLIGQDSSKAPINPSRGEGHFFRGA